VHQLPDRTRITGPGHPSNPLSCLNPPGNGPDLCAASQRAPSTSIPHRIMPEIAEVARIVHYIRKHLVGKTLTNVVAVEDASIYGKVGTSGAEFQKALTGKKVVDAGQQGKYFWIVMSSPPHPVMHFGMTGWLKIKSEDTYYYKPQNGQEQEEWPPRFWKFHLETKEEPKVEAAFVDSRRFSRIRLVNCPADQLRKTTPLVENGPDPVVDKHLVTEEWLIEKCRAKKVPIKALLLDQANISGIGNWVGDEIMYHAKIHPEQYSNTLSDGQLKQLHKSIHYICGTAVELLGESDKFPETWLFRHRWGKGKKDVSKTLPNGEKIVFLTVGGRTSAVVPSVQKKTGPVAKEMSEAESAGEEDAPKKAKKTTKQKKSEVDDDDDDVGEENGTEVAANGSTKKPTPKKSRQSKFKEEISDEEEVADTTATTNGRKRKSGEAQSTPAKKRGHPKEENAASRPAVKRKTDEVSHDAPLTRRKSGRVMK
jgi:formamidopyrimidine-DNA glycosylase